MTTEQFMDGTKDVTRRLGWRGLEAGDRVLAVVKAQGLKKGERQEVLGVIEIVSARREPLARITAADVRREGFPRMSRKEFVAMFCRQMGCRPIDYVTRIEFRRVDKDD